VASTRTPEPTTVLLVRHGSTPTTGKVLPGRAPGLHLGDLGRAQAEVVADRIGTLAAVHAVYASPLERARETAAPIAKACGLRVRRDAGLTECDFGDWTGRQISTLARRNDWQTVQRAPSMFTFPGGESFAGMQLRITETIARLCAAHPGETIVAVSHADTIKAAAAAALGTPLDLFQRIVISPCSITAVRYSSAGPVVLAVNSTGADLVRSIPS
jgi:probable phosphoglycerate mutase